MVLVFDDVNTAPKKGTLLVDQIMLERVEGGMPKQMMSQDNNDGVPQNVNPAKVASPG